MIFEEQFISNGFSFIEGATYLATNAEQQSFQKLREYYQTDLQQDGPRLRAYLKLEWDRADDQIHIAKNQAYFQSPENNNIDGGKIRQFKVMDHRILELPIIQRIIQVNKNMIANYSPLSHMPKLILGMHFIQYYSEQLKACYSSPVGLHIDDEPLVFVHLVHLSSHSLGGDNLIARLEDQEITHVIRLEQPMETLALNNNCYHAVTPLGSKKDSAVRDIILFTVEPDTTQINAA